MKTLIIEEQPGLGLLCDAARTSVPILGQNGTCFRFSGFTVMFFITIFQGRQVQWQNNESCLQGSCSLRKESALFRKDFGH